VRDGKPVLASRRVVSTDGKTMTITILNVDQQGKETVVEQDPGKAKERILKSDESPSQIRNPKLQIGRKYSSPIHDFGFRIRDGLLSNFK